MFRFVSDEVDRLGCILVDWKVFGSICYFIVLSCGVQVVFILDFVDLFEFDYVVVVGGLFRNDLVVDDEILWFFKIIVIKNVLFIGICIGMFIFVEVGLMCEYEICVSWFYYQIFCECFFDYFVCVD